MSRPPGGRGRRGQTRRRNPARPVEEIEIRALAARGDGEGRLGDGSRVFVPLTLPGDVVRVRPGARRGDGLAAAVETYVHRAPRADPFCPAFGVCGGCRLQHQLDADYVAWKTGAVRAALRRHGIDVTPAPLRRVPTGSRRRATFAAVRTEAGVVLGFNAARSDRVVDLAGCPLLLAPLQRIMAPLRALLAHILPPAGRADIAVTVADAEALDMIVAAAGAPDLAAREHLAAFAETHDIARLSWSTAGGAPEPVAARREVTVDLGGVAVALPAGCFLQPSTAGEATLRDLVTAGLGAADRIADLYCGIGTFALPIAAAGRHVTALDGDAAQIAAMTGAAGRAGFGGRVDGSVRDLAARPLEADDLAAFDAVVFDPPRAGARAQAERLADAAVARVVAVSCNPATLGRDLAILISGGYVLETVTPVDQFPMTPHVEAVAVLSRNPGQPPN